MLAIGVVGADGLNPLGFEESEAAGDRGAIGSTEAEAGTGEIMSNGFCGVTEAMEEEDGPERIRSAEGVLGAEGMSSSRLLEVEDAADAEEDCMIFVTRKLETRFSRFHQQETRAIKPSMNK